MNTQTQKSIITLISLIMLLVGYYYVYEYSNGYVLFGLFMAQWSNNISQKEQLRRNK